jgi:hypothetical protein
LLLLTVFVLTLPIRAALFDWDAAYGTWTSGSPAVGTSASQYYDIDGSGPVDVGITIKNNNNNASGFAWVGGYPAVNKTLLTGGASPTQNALQLAANSGNNLGITVTITFTAPVTNASFSLWDIDKTAGSYIDQISNINGLTAGGATVAPISVTGASSNQVTGSGTSFLITGTSTSTNTGAGSNDGNATITFGTTAIKSITFTWKNTDAGESTQYIALSDISFTPLPEVGSSLAALALCGGVVGFRVMRKRNRRK